jgi:hypothetical protein
MSRPALYFMIGFIVGAMTTVALGWSLAVEHGHPRDRRKLLAIVSASAILLGLFVGWAVDAFFAFMPRFSY